MHGIDVALDESQTAPDPCRQLVSRNIAPRVKSVAVVWLAASLLTTALKLKSGATNLKTLIHFKMVCAKCQKSIKPTALATPGVKKKNDMYYGSPSGSGAGSIKSGDKTKTSATLGNAGIHKVSKSELEVNNIP